ncbi:MAG: lytic transglycosylase domain-containing protein [Candidatus Omnitrophica bacterium]|nr:lytic transglycosylase domain-containing protein [Candidatus Omnitrophota bacterium]
MLTFGFVGVADAADRAPQISQSLYAVNDTGTQQGLSSEDRKILWALNQQEASGRSEVQSRYEPNFYRLYLQNNALFKAAEIKYGSKAISSSYGPWQIMYTTAVEMGYRGDPSSLAKASVSLPYVLRYIEKLKRRFDGNIQKVISAYNAGPGGVGTNPKYTSRVMGFYQKAPSTWRVYGAESYRYIS